MKRGVFKINEVNMNEKLIGLSKVVRGLFIAESVIALCSILLVLIPAIILIFLGKILSGANDINGLGVVTGAISYTFSGILFIGVIPSAIYMIMRFFVSLRFYKKALKSPTVESCKAILTVNIVFSVILALLGIIGIFMEIILVSLTFNFIYVTILIIDIIFTMRYCRLTIEAMQ